MDEIYIYILEYYFSHNNLFFLSFFFSPFFSLSFFFAWKGTSIHIREEGHEDGGLTGAGGPRPGTGREARRLGVEARDGEVVAIDP